MLEYILTGTISFIVAAVLAGAICFKVGINYRKKIAEAEIGSAEEEKKRIINEAYKAAEAKKKEVLIEGKEEVHRLRQEAEKELRERRNEVQRSERNLQQKEDRLDRKTEQLEKKDETLNQKIKEAEVKIAESEEIKKSQLAMLEKISQFTTEQAKIHLLDTLRGDLEHENATILKEYENRLKEDSDRKARELISLAIQRVAAGRTSLP